MSVNLALHVIWTFLPATFTPDNLSVTFSQYISTPAQFPGHFSPQTVYLQSYPLRKSQRIVQMLLLSCIVMVLALITLLLT